MLSGVFPYDGSPLLRALQGATAAAPRISERAPSVRVIPAAEALALRLIQKNPQDRYNNAVEVIAALDCFAATQDSTEHATESAW